MDRAAAAVYARQRTVVSDRRLRAVGGIHQRRLGAIPQGAAARRAAHLPVHPQHGRLVAGARRQAQRDHLHPVLPHRAGRGRKPKLERAIRRHLRTDLRQVRARASPTRSPTASSSPTATSAAPSAPTPAITRMACYSPTSCGPAASSRGPTSSPHRSTGSTSVANARTPAPG